MPFDPQPIDAVRLRILMDALKDTGRTKNPIVLPLAYFLRSKQQNLFHPVEVELGRMLSSNRPEEQSQVKKVFGKLFPYLKELEPNEFVELIADIKAGGEAREILEDGFKAGNLEGTAERLKGLRYLGPEYSAMTGAKTGLRAIGRLALTPIRSIRNSTRSIRYDLASPKTQRLMERGLKGGPGSGNFGHTGRIGGGSNPTIPRGGAVSSGIHSAVPGLKEREQ